MTATADAQRTSDDGRRRRARKPLPTARPAMSRRRSTYAWAVLAALAVGVLFFAFQSGQQTNSTAGAGFTVGDPGQGEQAPPLRLPATSGKTVDLADYKGRSVLLYFQEGIGCQPCWDQIRDLELQAPAVQAAGVDAILSVTTSPLDLIARKAADEGITTPVASDTDLAVSESYEANKYGMMGTGADGHSFVLVGPDGAIDWRADYGGAPKFTMYVPVDKLLSDLAAARGRKP